MRSRNSKSIPKLAFLLQLFQSRKRMDGRDWTEFRFMDVEFDEETGMTMASLGRTRVMCLLATEISVPRKSSRPGAGSISFSLDFLPMAHPSAVDSNCPDADVVEQCLVLLESLFRDTYCIDFETLCIEANKFVFDLKCTIKVLDYDGGLWDCCTMAVSKALASFRRNDVTYNAVAKKLISHSFFDKPPIPLTIYYRPMTVTFGFIGGISEPIVDPNLEESSLVDGFLIVGANHRDEVCLMHQSGNLDITPAQVKQCNDIAIRYAKELCRAGAQGMSDA